MDDKYTSKLSPTVDFWAGMYLVIIGKYTVLFHCLTVMSFLGIFLLCLSTGGQKTQSGLSVCKFLFVQVKDI